MFLFSYYGIIIVISYMPYLDYIMCTSVLLTSFTYLSSFFIFPWSFMIDDDKYNSVILCFNNFDVDTGLSQSGGGVGCPSSPPPHLSSFLSVSQSTNGETCVLAQGGRNIRISSGAIVAVMKQVGLSCEIELFKGKKSQISITWHMF